MNKPRATFQAVILTISNVLCFGISPAARFHVDANTPCTGPCIQTGLSWSTAFSTINQAVSAASAPGADEIWIADGIYSQSSSLSPGSNIALYGGFEGAGGAEETVLSQQDWQANRTIIRRTSGSGAVIFGNSVSNVTLDGLFITRDASTTGRGIQFGSSSGTILIEQCAVYQNNLTSAAVGAGIYFPSGTGNFTIRECVVMNNNAVTGAASDGTGICFQGGSGSRTVDRTFIIGNFAGDDGAGLSIGPTGGSGTYTSLIQNTVFALNQAFDDGGAVQIQNVGTAPQFRFCTFADNLDDGGDGVSGAVFIRSSSGTPSFINTVFARNTGVGVFDGRGGSASITIQNDLFFNNPGGLIDPSGGGAVTTLAALNAIPGNSDNRVGDPQFRMDTTAFITGTWTAPPSYDAATGLTTLTDATAKKIAKAGPFPPGKLALKGFINADISGPASVSQIISNDDDEIIVLGDLTGTVASGDSYRIVSYDVGSIISPAVDAAQFLAPVTVDIANNPRTVSVSPFSGPFVDDIGAYEVQSDPLLVTLSFFRASVEKPEQTVLLEWGTASEESNAGFHIYRSINAGPSIRLTETLIPGLGDSLVGAEYSFIDQEPIKSGEVREYWLEDTEFDGDTNRNGPVFVSLPEGLDASVPDWRAFD